MPCIYNGDLFDTTAIPEYAALPADTSVLVGRGAMWNPSIFGSRQQQPAIPLLPLVDQYIRTAAIYGPAASNTKYVAMEMLKPHCSTLDNYKHVVQAKDVTQLHAAVEALTAEARQKAAGEEEWKEEVVAGRGKAEKRLREIVKMRQLVYGPYVPPLVRWEERPVHVAAEERKEP